MEGVALFMAVYVPYGLSRKWLESFHLVCYRCPAHFRVGIWGVELAAGICSIYSCAPCFDENPHARVWKASRQLCCMHAQLYFMFGVSCSGEGLEGGWKALFYLQLLPMFGH